MRGVKIATPAVAVALALAGHVGISEARIILLPAAGGEITTRPTQKRDEVLRAIRGGDRPLLTVDRRAVVGRPHRVLQLIDMQGRPAGQPRSLDAVERRRYGPFEEISLDGRRMAYASTDDLLRVNWDVGGSPVGVDVASLRSGQPRRVLNGLDGQPALGWSPDSRTLWIAGRRGGRLSLWSTDMRTWRTRRRATLRRAPYATRRLAIGPHDGQVAYGAEDGVQVVDLEKGRQSLLQPALVQPPGVVRALPLTEPAWSPTASLIAAQRGRRGAALELIDPTLGMRNALPEPEDAYDAELAWAPDGRTFARALYLSDPVAYRLETVDVLTGQATVRLTRAGRVFELTWSADSRWLAVTDFAD